MVNSIVHSSNSIQVFSEPTEKTDTSIPQKLVAKSIDADYPHKDEFPISMVWENEYVARLGEWEGEKFNLFPGNFIQLQSSPNYRHSPYVFKPGTNCLDITNDPKADTDILEKIGFVFFKVDVQRLRNSSKDVQETIMLSLLSCNYYLRENDNRDYAIQTLPGIAKENISHFLMVEKCTGKVAGAIFSEMRNNKFIELDSIFVAEEFRKKGLGNLLLSMTIRHHHQGNDSTKFIVRCSNTAYDWYIKFGFCPSKKNPAKLTLSFRDNEQ